MPAAPENSHAIMTQQINDYFVEILWWKENWMHTDYSESQVLDFCDKYREDALVICTEFYDAYPEEFLLLCKEQTFRKNVYRHVLFHEIDELVYGRYAGYFVNAYPDDMGHKEAIPADEFDEEIPAVDYVVTWRGLFTCDVDFVPIAEEAGVG